MMKSSLRSDNRSRAKTCATSNASGSTPGFASYESGVRVESAVMPGVWFVVHKMSFARRINLTRRIRDLAERVEFLNAGENTKEKMDASLLAAEIDGIYVLWGLTEVGGLELDGTPATPESLVVSGPEELFREAL